jgi:hypothetical protein
MPGSRDFHNEGTSVEMGDNDNPRTFDAGLEDG